MPWLETRTAAIVTRRNVVYCGQTEGLANCRRLTTDRCRVQCCCDKTGMYDDFHWLTDTHLAGSGGGVV